LKFLFSDTHLDNGNGEFTTSGGAVAFNNFLDVVGDQELIGNGDILDLWEWSWKEISNGPNMSIIKRLAAHPNFTYILGNHDLLLGWISTIFHNAKVEMAIELDSYIVFHGFQIDPKLNTQWKRWFAAEGDRLVEQMNNPVFRKIRQWFAAGDRTNKPLIAALEDTDKKFLIGHSHHPINLNGWYINSGCWISGDPCFITIDDSGVAELHWWNNDTLNIA
jgi:UDP-2,3-diacylglucosamine pyrophosphatase LpxH